MTDPNRIRAEARHLLMGLLERTAGVSKHGKGVSYREFFPVDVKEVITEVLDWQLRPLEDYDLRAKCDFTRKIIFFNVSRTTTGEMNYSLAHEIGHAVLHKQVVQCYGGSLNRPLRSVRRGIREPQPPKVAGLETDADQFAAELLMPPKAVREHFRTLFGEESLGTSSPKTLLNVKLGAGAPPYDVALELADSKPSSSLPTLAQQFGTSRSAMARRLVHLRLIHN